MIVKGGRQHYGQAIGIAMLDRKYYPMIPGDVGNASSYNFPVRMNVISGLEDNPFPPIRDPAGNYTPDVIKTIVAVKELEKEGVRAVVTCCGFFSLIQDVLAREVGIPVFTSPLMLVPLIVRMLRPDQCVGILTASAERMSADYLEPAGIDPGMPVVIEGLEGATEFYATHMGGTRTVMDVTLLRDQIVAISEKFVRRHPQMGAVLLECTTLPSFAADIQAAVDLPVFDYMGFIHLLYRSIVQKRYTGFV